MIISQSVRHNSAGQSERDAQSADLSVGLKVRGTEYLGSERSMQEGDVRR